MIVMSDVPEDFSGVARVEIKGRSVVVREKSKQRVLRTRAKSFL